MIYDKNLKKLIVEDIVSFNEINFFISNNDVSKIEFYENDLEYIYKIINKLKDRNILFTISSNKYLDQNMYDNSSLIKENIINKFAELGINKKIFFDEYIWDVSSAATIRLDYIVKANEFYEKIVNDISSYDFSTYEKFIATHMLVQKYSNYSNGGNNNGFKNSNLSRNPILLIEEDQIVCAGYAGMESIILNKLGIESEIILCNRDGYPHARCISKINDSKYNINGNYLSDPTFDSNIYFNLLNNSNNEKVMPYFTSKVFMNLSSDILNNEKDITYGVASGLTDKKEANFTSAGNNSIKMIASLSDENIDEDTVNRAMNCVISKIYAINSAKDKKNVAVYVKMIDDYCKKYAYEYNKIHDIKKR